MKYAFEIENIFSFHVYQEHEYTCSGLNGYI